MNKTTSHHRIERSYDQPIQQKFPIQNPGRKKWIPNEKANTGQRMCESEAEKNSATKEISVESFRNDDTKKNYKRSIEFIFGLI